MSTRRRLATAASPHAALDQSRPAPFDESEILEFWVDPALDRRLRGLVRSSGASLAGFCLSDTSHRLVKTHSDGEDAIGRATESQLPDSLEAHLLALAAEVGPGEIPCLYQQAAVVVAGREIGKIGMASHSTAWTDAALDALHDAAESISTELALRLSRKQALRVHQLMKSHSQLHHMIARDAPLPDVLLELCRVIEKYDPSLVPSVLLIDPASNTLHSGIGPSLPLEYLAAVDGVVIGPNIGTCGPAAWFGRLTISPDLVSDPKWAPIIGLVQSAGLAHCWSMPIKAAGEEVLGTLAFYGRQPREPLPEHLELLEDCAQVAAIAIERSQTLERLSHDARHDGLTGLANRRAIFEELDAAIERVDPRAAAAVLFIDLDGLKEMNDTLGHDRADEMIHEVAQRLSLTIREHDFVGRFGGDEFIVIAEGITDAAEAGELASRLLEAIAQPLPVLDGKVITASIGIALVRSNAVDAREAIRNSDTAMYAAKRSGRDRCMFSEEGHQAHAGRRLQIARELRGAEVRGEMRLVFQPVIALPTMEIVGVEALLRWTSPTFGEVSPVEFIAIAERAGTIVPIGGWVLRESCEAMARLAQLGHDLELNVNVSAFQVSQPDFPLWVRQTVAHAEFPVTRLGLEITETALMRPDATTTYNLHELNALGAQIVLDDFGTGYSSLTWLKQHPFSSIKIDRSFISELPDDKGDRAIVAGVIGMANALGCVVTAEGVETEQQLAALRALGCGRVQGFLLARPVPMDELIALLAHGSQLAG